MVVKNSEDVSNNARAVLKCGRKGFLNGKRIYPCSVKRTGSSQEKEYKSINARKVCNSYQNSAWENFWFGNKYWSQCPFDESHKQNAQSENRRDWTLKLWPQAVQHGHLALHSSTTALPKER